MKAKKSGSPILLLSELLAATALVLAVLFTATGGILLRCADRGTLSLSEGLSFVIRRMTITLIASLLPLTAADLFLFGLFRKIRRKEIFSAGATRDLIRIAVCCFTEAALLFAMTVPDFFRALSHGVGVALLSGGFGACLLGMVLLVVAEVISEATGIKEENDLTV